MKKMYIVAIACMLLSSIAVGQKKYGETPEDSLECIKNISLYREFFKQWKDSKYTGNTVKDAFGSWRSVFLKCPQASLYTYVDGVTMVNFYYQNEKDLVRKDKYFDTLMMVYDQRIKYFGKEGYVLGRKATDIFDLKPSLSDEAYNTFKKSVEIQGNETEPNVTYKYLLATINNSKAGKIGEDVIFEVFDKTMTICESHMSNPKDTATYGSAIRNLESIIEPIAKCINLVPMYSKKFDASPNDTSLLRKITDMLDAKGCITDPLYLKAAKNLYAANPTPSSAIKIARLEAKKGNFSSAISMYQDAVEKETDDAKKAQYYYELATVQYNAGNKSGAKNSCHKALSLKPNMGDAYILIGNIVASTSGCGDNAVMQKSIYWLAVDYFQKAKSVDASVSVDANKQISRFSAQFPNQEDAFFYNIKSGDEVVVPCYGEKTKARF